MSDLLLTACSVCYGDPESPLAKGAVSGVWALLSAIAIVQVGLGYFFFVYLRRRAKIYQNGSLKPTLRIVKE